MKNKKNIVIAILIVIAIVVALGVIVYNKSANADIEKQKQALNTYIAYINEKNYEGLYGLISVSSKEKISKEDFVKRNKNIYEGIDAANINISINEMKETDGKKQISYGEKLYTSAGEVSFSNLANLVKENNEYKLEWSSKLIFPELQENYKVRVSSIEAKRGSIKDKSGNMLAYDGKASSVGIVPGKLGENKEENIAKISEILEVSKETINDFLNASYVKDDTFVPIKKIPKSSDRKQALLEIDGIMITDADARVYELGEEAGHLIGYVQSINAEELEKNQGKGYTSTSIIGKSGIEQAYEETLKGIDGTEIYIADENGEKVKELAKQDKKDGADVTLTIDSQIQKNLYNQLKDDKGFFVVMEPQTGELLALVSTPTYDSNDFSLGMTNAKWDSLLNGDGNPLYSKFLQIYSPGSTFKPITGAIGLTTGKIDENSEFSYTGKSWQKDSSWGDYFVTTLTAYSGNKNLRNAIIHSDNIFFAQAALAIGADTLKDNLDKIGFNEEIEFPLSIRKSQYLGDGNTLTEGKLANTGYGQGDILVNPIHMASIYSAFANNGNMIKPYIEYKENVKPTILKQNVFSESAANTIKDNLIQVVENSEGTANDARIDGLTIAGKTGTAELKASKDDTESGTLGWFDCFTTNRENQNLLIIGMVENNKENAGSHYVIQKIRTILE